MTVQEAKAEIARLEKFIVDEEEREKAAAEAALVEAHAEAKHLCDVVARRMNLDPWRLFGTYRGARYPRIRAIIYWELHRRGYDTKTIGLAFGRRSDIWSCVQRVDMKMKIQE
jgi:hypothetical protein